MHSSFLEDILVQMFKIPLRHEIDNATSYFLISSKNLKWKQNFHNDTFWNYLLLNMVIWWGLNIKDGGGSGKGQWRATIVWYVDTLWRNLQCVAAVI